ncbi:hypothetical protein D3C84_798240 [compost metagenome]
MSRKPLKTLGITGGEDDWQRRIHQADGVGQLRTTHLRHGHVGDDQIDIRFAVEQLQSPGPGGSADHPVTQVLQQQARAGQYQAVIVHHQHTQPRHCNGRLLRCRFGDRAVGGDRQPELGGRAKVLPAFEDKAPTQLLNEPMHHRQSEPCAFADTLGGKERIHRRGQRDFVHALPGIGHIQADIAPNCQG